jgi:hypothetical protein
VLSCFGSPEAAILAMIYSLNIRPKEQASLRAFGSEKAKQSPSIKTIINLPNHLQLPEAAILAKTIFVVDHSRIFFMTRRLHRFARSGNPRKDDPYC